jgi:hypothetical protein
MALKLELKLRMATKEIQTSSMVTLTMKARRVRWSVRPHTYEGAREGADRCADGSAPRHCCKHRHAFSAQQCL